MAQNECTTTRLLSTAGMRCTTTTIGWSLRLFTRTLRYSSTLRLGIRVALLVLRCPCGAACPPQDLAVL